MSWHPQPWGDVEQWRIDLCASTLTLAGDEVAMVVADPLDGRIIVTSPALGAMLGRNVERVEDLVEIGFVARPDLDEITRHLAAWRALDAIEGHGRETMHAWSTELSVHARGASHRVRLDILHHRRPQIAAEAVVATLRAGAADVEAPPPNDFGVGIDDRFWLVYDGQMRILGADPRMASFGVDPNDQAGAVAALTVHPADLPEAMPLVLDVVFERATVANFTVRLRTSQGWLPTQMELRRMISPMGTILVGQGQLLPSGRMPLPTSLLSERELAILSSLHDGMRVAMIAERDKVSPKTIRNQLSAIYAKLGVTGQEELLRTYARPGR